MITTSCHSIVCSNANAFTAVHFVFYLSSLSYVNHVYKLAQQDWNFRYSLFSLASCDTSSSTSIDSFTSGCTCVRLIFCQRIFLHWRREKWYFMLIFFKSCLFERHLLSFDSFHYNWIPSMKNAESIRWLYDWFPFSPDYVRGMKQKLRINRNKKISMQIPVTGARCTMTMGHTWR
jgi:hypothetical protein